MKMMNMKMKMIKDWSLKILMEFEEGYFNSNPNNENSQNILTFDEFYPIKKSFDINKKKRKYNEIVDLENELLNFWGGINASKRLKK